MCSLLVSNVLRSLFDLGKINIGGQNGKHHEEQGEWPRKKYRPIITGNQQGLANLLFKKLSKEERFKDILFSI